MVDPIGGEKYFSCRQKDCQMTDTDTSFLPERKRGSGVKMVYDLLRDEILDLVLPPGSPIDEVQLAERFKLSRTPIREALRRLADEDLVEVHPRRAIHVTPVDGLRGVEQDVEEELDQRIRISARGIGDNVKIGEGVEGVVRLMPPSGPVRLPGRVVSRGGGSRGSGYPAAGAGCTCGRHWMRYRRALSQ
jgi:DNA-binding transcriptional regulator YhcF (GntR family)